MWAEIEGSARSSSTTSRWLRVRGGAPRERACALVRRGRERLAFARLRPSASWVEGVAFASRTVGTLTRRRRLRHSRWRMAPVVLAPAVQMALRNITAKESQLPDLGAIAGKFWSSDSESEDLDTVILDQIADIGIPVQSTDDAQPSPPSPCHSSARKACSLRGSSPTPRSYQAP